MTELEVFLTLATAHAIAVISPGPDFAIVARYSLAYGRHIAMWTALGIGTGILVHVFYSIVGLGILIATNELTFSIFKYTGVVYLLFLSYQGWQSGEQHRKRQADIAGEGSANRVSSLVRTPKALKAYRDGLLTNALNVKASMFFLALFLLVTYDSLPALQILYGFYLAIATAFYFCLLAWFFARFHPLFRRHLVIIEKGTALLLAFLALLLVLFAGQPDFS